VQYGSGGFGLRFDLLFTTAVFVVGVLAGLLGSAPSALATHSTDESVVEG
jgi:demethoxyubiquinone hydroxylase (CLK1/Coq7/Cat5 family)